MVIWLPTEPVYVLSVARAVLISTLCSQVSVRRAVLVTCLSSCPLGPPSSPSVLVSTSSDLPSTDILPYSVIVIYAYKKIILIIAIPFNYDTHKAKAKTGLETCSPVSLQSLGKNVCSPTSWQLIADSDGEISCEEIN